MREREALLRVADRQDLKDLKALQTKARKKARLTFKALEAKYKKILKEEKSKLITLANAEAEAAFNAGHVDLADAGVLAIHIASTDTSVLTKEQ
jgi:hypothetical protein